MDNKKDIKVHDSETSSLLEKMKNQEIDNKPKTWQKRWNDSERPVYFGVNKDNYYEEANR